MTRPPSALQAIAPTLQSASTAAAATHERAHHFKGFFVSAAVIEFGFKAGLSPMANTFKNAWSLLMGEMPKVLARGWATMASNRQRLDALPRSLTDSSLCGFLK